MRCGQFPVPTMAIAAVCAMALGLAAFPADASSVTRNYSESETNILNPERGFFEFQSWQIGSSVVNARANGFTLSYVGVRLDNYKDRALDSAMLNAINDKFDDVRAMGFKALLRFVYCDDGSDAPKEIILQHIAQLQPVLEENADVIAAMHAGFIGKWGEWHSSSNGLDNNTDRGDILSAILNALPSNRMVMIRTPHFKRDLVGGPLTAAEAFTGTARARVGHLNDAFLASSNDMGTYLSSPSVEWWKQFVEDDGWYVPVGGETCAMNSPRTDGPSAVAEMRRLHWSFLNRRYLTSVINGWISQGYYDQIVKELGYRLTIQNATWPESTAAGTDFTLQVTGINRGYAAPVNERPVFAVLERGGKIIIHELTTINPRLWRGGQTFSFTVAVPIPSDASAGSYKLSLWLPDDAVSIHNRPEYAIQFANVDIWESATGYNILASDVNITSGGSVPSDDTDGDGLDDAWEIEHFGDLSSDGTGDADGDGYNDIQEYAAGTDPNDPVDHPINKSKNNTSCCALNTHSANPSLWLAATGLLLITTRWRKY